MEKYNFFKTGRLHPSKEQLLDTKLFYRNSVEIYTCFNDWKDIDKFYFIPLYMEMTYCMGWVAEIAPDPVWLGSFVRCTQEHSEQFQYQCPKCGKVVHPFRYVGSPLSGIVDLEGRCGCGWKGYERVSGWRLRATALRDQIAHDTARNWKYKVLHLGAGAATIEKLMAWMRS